MIDRRTFLRGTLMAGIGTAIGIDSKANAEIENLSLKINDQIPQRRGKSVMALATKPLKTVRIGVVGLGRGLGAVDALCHIEGTDIVAICDLDSERIKKPGK